MAATRFQLLLQDAPPVQAPTAVVGDPADPLSTALLQQLLGTDQLHRLCPRIVSHDLKLHNHMRHLLVLVQLALSAQVPWAEEPTVHSHLQLRLSDR
jgi:hypothetical protein